MSLIYFTLTLQAELPPSFYEGEQNNAPEVLIIVVKNVDTSFISFSEKSITVTAKVRYVERTKTNLKENDIVTIRYTTVFWRPLGWAGPSSIQVLEEGSTYKAYLEKDANSNYYSPATRGKSFR